MPRLVTFAGDELGALSADRVILISGVLLLVAMLVYEFFDAGTDMLIATVDPGVEATETDIHVVTVANTIDR